MASNLSCVGLAVADPDELARLAVAVLPDAVRIGGGDGVETLRWEDPSGARLVISLHGQQIADLLPSFGGRPGARLANVRSAREEIFLASVVDEDGEQCTAMAVALEQRWWPGSSNQPGIIMAAVTALGAGVSVHADEAAFAASDASLLGNPGEAGEPPPHFREKGWAWPPRMASESFISHGVFGPPEEAEAYARLAGTVLGAERRTVTQTGQDFIVARVRTAGFETDLCLAATEHPGVPAPGSIIAGTVFLIASLQDAATA